MNSRKCLIYAIRISAKEVDEIDSREYLSELVDKYQNLVFSICYKMTKDYFISQDLTQETYLSAFRRLGSFDGANEKAWICRIASNKCIDYIRSGAGRTVPADEEMMPEGHSDEGLPERESEENDTRERLRINCSRLKDPYNEVATLFFADEMSPDEIARRRSTNVKTIQTQIYRARNQLREIYREEYSKDD